MMKLQSYIGGVSAAVWVPRPVSGRAVCAEKNDDSVGLVTDWCASYAGKK